MAEVEKADLGRAIFILTEESGRELIGFCEVDKTAKWTKPAVDEHGYVKVTRPMALTVQAVQGGVATLISPLSTMEWIDEVHVRPSSYIAAGPKISARWTVTVESYKEQFASKNGDQKVSRPKLIVPGSQGGR